MKEISTSYDQSKESEIYKRWEDSGYFNPDNLSGEPFSIMMPPPNATGTLHIGHAFEASIQDILIRYHRMLGEKTLWLPGTDHAAIATNTKVEKILIKEEGKNRHDIGREAFVKKVEDFVEESRGTIQKQIKTLGASADWSREAFTFDEPRNLAVRTAFKRMYDAGLIYRGIRVINWDAKGQTSVSDDEVVHKAEKGMLYTFKYSKDFPISIATTRPETKVGDVAVAVNPKDTRYTKYIGKEYDIEFAGAKLKIKIVADDVVDPEFGTGAVGVTPAHSITDYEIAQRHDLPAPQIINEYAKMMDSAGSLVAGKKTKEAREIIVNWLNENGLLEKTEEIDINIATAERSGGVIEPLPKLQWFINVNKEFEKDGQKNTLKKLMQNAVKSGDINILPDRFEKVYFNWIDNLRDWNISRQLWYGHQIPVWYCDCGNIVVSIEIPKTCDLCAENKDIAFGEPRKDAQLRTSIIAYVENEAGDKILTIDWGPDLGGKLLVGGGRNNDEDPIECALREITEETGYSEIEFVEQLPQKITHNYFAASKKIWKTIDIVALKFRLKSNKRAEPKLEEDEKNKFSVSWQSKDELFIQITDKAHGYILRKFARLEPKLIQDPDTLDTWFSSALWTFSTLGWPDQTKDLKTFHPTSVMAPGYEILFFWVARMILMSTFLLGEVPFKTVYLHGIVRDITGKKFSKSLDNGIDPIDVIEKYGADALRMALVVGVGAGNDSKYDEQKVRGYRNFANKIWNASRFVYQNSSPLAGEDVASATGEGLLPEDQKILDDLKKLVENTTKQMDKFDFAHAAEDLYHYFWHTFADKIIEESKAKLANEKTKASAQKMLMEVLEINLKLLHPFAPFVTEAIWQLNHKDLLMIQQWPK